MIAIDCAWVDENDAVPRYVGGRLGDAEVEVFEAHCLVCERCWAETRAAVDIRDAAGVEFVAIGVQAPRRFTRDTTTLLAAAAAVLVAIVGLVQLARGPAAGSPERVWRSLGAAALPVTVGPEAPDALVLRWPRQEGAEVYAVEISAMDGSTVLDRETSATALRIGPGDLPPRAPGATLYATVRALDATRQTIARSERTALPPP